MLPEAGQRFGPYEILAMLGGGGMGVVFRAWDERLHREVAVKLLHDEYRAPGMRERFRLEARAASALAHPHICTIFDIGEQNGEPYLVMELLQGCTLKQMIGQRACSAEEIVRFGEEIAEALSAAHAKGIVHRDIKPANVFLQDTASGEPTVKILDFGLAKVSMALRSGRDSRALELTSVGFTVGTLAYMSPEQARGEALDARTDLFSLGALLYEMATRRTPFRGATTALAFQALLAESPEPLRTWNISVPREVERIIMRLLQKERRQRYPNAGAVQDAFAGLLSRGGGEWLRRLPSGVVPLVPAEDPVARDPRPRPTEAKETPLGQNGADSDHSRIGASLTEGGAPPPAAASGGELLRPRRMPQQESRPRETSFSQEGSRGSQGRASGKEAVRETALGTAQEAARETRSGGQGRAEMDPVSARSARPSSRDAATKRAAEPGLTKPAEGPREPVLAVPEKREPAGVAAAGNAVEGPRAMAAEDRAASVKAGAGTAGRLVAVQTGIASVPIISDPSFRRQRERTRSSSGEMRVATAPVTEAPVKPEAAVPLVGRTGQKSGGRRAWLVVIGLLAAAVVGLLWMELRTGSFGRIALAPTDSILLAPVANRTNDPTLDGVVLEGLRLSMAERSDLRWLGADPYAAGVRMVSREERVPATRVRIRSVARRLGARAYISGEIAGGPEHMNIRLNVIDASSNDRLGGVSEAVSSRRDLPAAISRVAQTLRARLGEVDAEESGAHAAELGFGLGVNRGGGEAAVALHAFAQGEAARASGDLLAAAAAYRESAAHAPGFAPALLRLAEIYAREGAELPAAEAANRALTLSSRAGDRAQMLARTTEQLLREDDVVAAAATIHRALAQWPRDPELLVALAWVMRVGGHMTEALLAGQRATALDPYSGEAFREEALALIGLNRYQEAVALSRRAEEKGVWCACDAVLARALLAEGGRAEPQGAAFTSAPMRPQDRGDAGLEAGRERALLLDDGGDFVGGLAAWRQMANSVLAEPEMVSAAAGMLATAASDRALASRCAEANLLTRQASLLAYGRTAAFHIALAGALCPDPGGDTKARAIARLEEGARARSIPMAQMMPLLRTAQAVTARRPLEADAALSSIPADHDTPALAFYLRGVSLALGGQLPKADAAFQQAAARHGSALLAGTIVSSLAERRVRHR